MASVIVAASHKGGTGRSVTMANVATSLAFRGANVCVLDLDLASPTFGTVAGFPTIGAGVEGGGTGQTPRSMHDILERCIDGEGAERKAYKYAADALWDIWGGDAFSDVTLPAAKGRLQLLPGRRAGSDGYTADKLAGPIRNIIEQVMLSGPADIVICDLRSGVSEPLLAFSDERYGLQDLVAGYVFHFRWTPQQLNGLDDLLQSVRSKLPLDRVRFIKTAVQSMDKFQDRPKFTEWLDRSNDVLARQFEKILGSISGEQSSILGEVPMDPLLQWRETIITESMVAGGVALKETRAAFDSIAERISPLV